MIKLLKHMDKLSYLLIFVVIGLVILQVYSDLELPTRLTNILTNASMAEAASLQGILTDELKSTYQNAILRNGLEMFGFAAISLVSSIVVCLLASRIAAKFSYNLRKEVYTHIQKFSISEIDKFSTASLITRTTNDITQVQMVVIMTLRMAIAAPTTAILGIIKAGRIESTANLSLIVVIAVITLVTLVVSIFLIVLPKFKKIQELTDRLNLVTRENLTGIRVVRANCAQEYQEKKFDEVNVSVSKTHIFVNRMLNLMNPGMMLIMNGTSLAILWVGAYIINERPEFLGSVFGFQQITMMIVIAFMQLIMIFIMVPRGLVSARRVRAVLDVCPSLSNPSNPISPEEEIKGTIEYVDVSFSYPNSNENVLDHISFKVNQGDTVAIIGSTGSGKTSLINLLPRFFDATEGKVLVDGVDVKDYDMEVLRDKIAFIAQKALLFKGTVRSNLFYGKEDATEEEMKEALQLSMADDFILNHPEGLDQGVAQGGSNFSGGQKQRLSIARALIKKPEIIVFDDSFSALDFKTDKILRDNLKKLEYNPTKIIVAQRIGTIMDADLILVLEKGKIVGAGTHKELIKNCEVYQEIAYSQVSKEEIDHA
ncbi:MAG: ABC transporter ATP-binding protein/permease [Anaeroplasmataceae bacterium]|nr:ABC transporter ATP-binding protein/permease [Anaeroplasmataceae bacterium]MDE6241554.1 ABC transporter ATP-binding protein/permease [Anaeroplasmataceae bacterium]